MKLVRAWCTLVFLSFRRLLWSSNTVMVIFPLVGAGLVLLRLRGWMLRRAAEDFTLTFERFSENFVLAAFASFLLPICALAYGTTSIGGDREDRTLLFLLIRPVPRLLILLAKWTATLPLVLGVVVGSFYLYCRLAGEVGAQAFQVYLPAVFYMSIAYVGLFHLFAVTFRHSTIIALIYTFFMELLIGNMPGIIKQVAVSYYGKSMIFGLGLDYGVPPPDVRWFEPVSIANGALSLVAIGLGGLLLAAIVFQRREYRDLT